MIACLLQQAALQGFLSFQRTALYHIILWDYLQNSLWAHYESFSDWVMADIYHEVYLARKEASSSSIVGFNF